MSETIPGLTNVDTTIAPEPPLERDVAQADVEVSVKQLTQWQLVWRRYRRHKLAMFGTGLFLFVVLVSLLAPFIEIVPSSLAQPYTCAPNPANTNTFCQGLPPWSYAPIPADPKDYATPAWTY